MFHGEFILLTVPYNMLEYSWSFEFNLNPSHLSAFVSCFLVFTRIVLVDVLLCMHNKLVDLKKVKFI